MNAFEGSDAGAVIQAAREGGTPTGVHDVDQPIIVTVPAGATVAELDLTAWRDAPIRARGVYTVSTVASFIAYLDKYAVADTTVWVQPGSGEAVGIIDDHGRGSPGWGEHRCVLHLDLTPEWTHWMKLDGDLVSQEQFAEHIEVGLSEIAEPASATVLELAQTFHARSSASFRQAIRLESGEIRLQYDESIAATAGKTGEIEIPKEIVLGISPFIGEEPYKVIARLRYRIGGGNLQIGYKLDRPGLVIRDALEAIAARLEEKFPLTFIGYGPQNQPR